MTDNHPDFEAATPERRWKRSLAELAMRLRTEAWGKPGEWAWVVLPRGAMVAMRTLDDQRKELRILRREPLQNDVALNKFTGECFVFLGKLGCEDWKVVSIGKDQKTKAVYLEPHVTCARCGREAQETPHKRPLCNPCAMALGAEEVAQHAAAVVSSSPPEGNT